MMKRRIGLITLSVLFVALAFWQGGGGPSSPGGPSTQTLPDGRTLTLLRHAYGTDHHHGSTLASLAARILPDPAFHAFGMKRPPRLHSGDPALAVWFHYEGTDKQLGRDTEFYIGDADGFLGGQAGRVLRRENDHGNGTLIGVVVTSLPRRSRTIRIAVHQPDGGWTRRRVAGFVIDNPAFGSGFPVWPATPLPTSVTSNRLEITLDRLALGTGSGRRFTPPAKGDAKANGLAAFVVRADGVVTKDWKPDGVVMADATGNERRQGTWGSTWRGTTNFFQWSPTLWPDTGGMRFRFEFTREEKSVFAPHELIVIRGVRIPAETNVTEINLITNKLGHTIRVVGLAGKRGRFDSYTMMGGGEMTLQVEVKPPLLDKQIDLVAVVDETGHPVDHGGSSWSRPKGRYAFRVQPGKPAQAVDLTLAVHTSVHVEFTVAPEVFAPAK